jgi:hypothetical protein
MGLSGLSMMLELTSPPSKSSGISILSMTRARTRASMVSSFHPRVLFLVRNRAKELADLLGDSDKIRTERKKSRASKSKYTGVGSDEGGFGGSGKKYGGFGSEDLSYGSYSGQVYGITSASIGADWGRGRRRIFIRRIFRRK